MEYKKIIKDNYTIHLTNTNRFKYIDVDVCFTKEFEKKDIAFFTLLTNNIVYSSKKYNTKNKIAIKGEELYGANISSDFIVLGNLERFTISLSFLDPKYTNDKYYKESIDFLFELLYNPNISKDSFEEKYFNIIKNQIITSLKAEKDNPKEYAKIEFNKLMYKNTPLEYSSKPTIDEIDIISSKDLYEFYEKIFSPKYKVDVLVLGSIDKLPIEVLEKYLNKIKCCNKKLDINIKQKNNIRVIEKIDSVKFNQSRLYIGFKLLNLTEYEMNYVMRVYNTILGTMNNSLLFNVVREQNSLCYSIGSYYTKYTKSLVIYSGINKTNYEKTLNLIKKCVNMMNDKKIIEENYKFAIKTINTMLNSYYDDSYMQTYQKYLNEFDKKEDIEKEREIINNVKVDEIISINNKIKLSVIYLLKGDN